MKTDWHRYNLKRRVAQLPSISSEVFAEKVMNLHQFEDTNGDQEDEYGFYVHRRKQKNNTNRLLTKLQERRAYPNFAEERVRLHEETDDDIQDLRAPSPVRSVASDLSVFSLGDEPHYESAAETGSEINYTSEDSAFDVTSDSGVSSGELEDDDDDDELSDTESFTEVALPITVCFFCGQNNKEIEPNIRHMYKHHGLYIPERSYLVDMEGLLLYLSEVITLDHECLVCGFEGKGLESVRQHMLSKGHCRLPYETEAEQLAIEEFYDFSTGPAEVKKKPAKFVSFSEVGKETDDADSITGNYSLVHTDSTGTEISLPTGSRIVHRSLARNPRPSTSLTTTSRESNTTVAIADRRFAPGITAHQLTKQQKDVFRLEQRQRNVEVKRTNKSAGTNYQKHYRDAILGT